MTDVLRVLIEHGHWWNGKESGNRDVQRIRDEHGHYRNVRFSGLGSPLNNTNMFGIWKKSRINLEFKISSRSPTKTCTMRL